MKQFESYLQQIKNGTFKQVSDNIFSTLQLEGFTEETNIPYKNCYEFINLKIDAEDKNGLKSLNDIVVNKFNQFDITLKESLGTKRYIDLIDYDTGKIKIVRLKDGCL